MSKTLGFLAVTIIILTFLPQMTPCQEENCRTKLYNWIDTYEKTISLDRGKHFAEFITIESANDRICGLVATREGWFDFIILDELSYYKWKANEEVYPLAIMKNAVSLVFFFIEIEKPGKYYVILIDKCGGIKEIDYLCTTAPDIPFDEEKMLSFPDDGYVADMCGDRSGHIEFLVNNAEPAEIATYIEGLYKIITITADLMPVNVVVKDENGITKKTFQALEGTHKLDLGLEKALLEIKTSSSEYAYVTIERY